MDLEIFGSISSIVNRGTERISLLFPLRISDESELLGADSKLPIPLSNQIPALITSEFGTLAAAQKSSFNSKSIPMILERDF